MVPSDVNPQTRVSDATLACEFFRSICVMSSTGSVTHWLDHLQAGDPTAAEKLWDSYFQRLVALARARLQGVPRSAADEEDVALSAFDSFCRGAQRGRFPQL